MAVPILIAVTGFVALPQSKTPAGAGQSTSTAKELSGAEMYRTYCASCHGLDGKGSGPAAAALKKTPPDLTLISKRNKGEFPAFRIAHIIYGYEIEDGYEIEAVHGSRDMPVWGDYFRDRNRDEAMLAPREHNPTEYLRSIQQK
jgi:mono/diheme cytochrome c family protein